MLLINGKKGGHYTVQSLMVKRELLSRLEALGLTSGAPVDIIEKKRSGTMILRLRGTRYAIGQEIAMGIIAQEKGDKK